MPKFYYIARDSEGHRVSGAEELSSQDELISRLQAKNMIVISITEDMVEKAVGIATETRRKQQKFRHYGVKEEDIILFSRQLATLLAAGVTILKSLDIISKQVASRKFYGVIKDLVKNMEAGLSFHEAISKHSKVFSELWVNLIESGEASGNLAVVLGRLAGYLERQASFKKKIISSLVYPMILLVAGTGALLFLTLKIIPTFVEVFKGFNIELPLLTKMLVNVSFFIRKYFLITAGAIFAFVFLVRSYIRTKEGRKSYERMLYNLPMFGTFFRALTIERFTSDLSTLIESGVPLLYSLEITEHSVSNLVLAELIRQVKDDVRQGKPLSYGLERSGFFDAMVTQMAAVGEEVGDLPQMFKRINTYYQEYSETFLNRFSTLFEPIMLLFMGAVIGIMVVGMFLPIFQLATAGGG